MLYMERQELDPETRNPGPFEEKTAGFQEFQKHYGSDHLSSLRRRKNQQDLRETKASWHNIWMNINECTYFPLKRNWRQITRLKFLQDHNAAPLQHRLQRFISNL